MIGRFSFRKRKMKMPLHAVFFLVIYALFNPLLLFAEDQNSSLPEIKKLADGRYAFGDLLLDREKRTLSCMQYPIR